MTLPQAKPLRILEFQEILEADRVMEANDARKKMVVVARLKHCRLVDPKSALRTWPSATANDEPLARTDIAFAHATPRSAWRNGGRLRLESNSTPERLSGTPAGQTGSLRPDIAFTGPLAGVIESKEQWVCPGSKGRFHRDGSADSSF
jgi:hypothetical protein